MDIIEFIDWAKRNMVGEIISYSESYIQFNNKENNNPFKSIEKKCIGVYIIVKRYYLYSLRYIYKVNDGSFKEIKIKDSIKHATIKSLLIKLNHKVISNVDIIVISNIGDGFSDKNLYNGWCIYDQERGCVLEFINGDQRLNVDDIIIGKPDLLASCQLRETSIKDLLEREPWIHTFNLKEYNLFIFNEYGVKVSDSSLINEIGNGNTIKLNSLLNQDSNYNISDTCQDNFKTYCSLCNGKSTSKLYAALYTIPVLLSLAIGGTFLLKSIKLNN